jgi:hypothetical protein
MYVYDPASDRLDELTAADGADLGTGWFLSRATTRDGRLLFGGSKGILVVTPERFDASAYTPPLLISELSINGQRQPAGRIRDGLRLPPAQRSFSLSFAALDYSDPGRLRYAYQLQGFDADWTHTTADARVASYSNLDPGDYVLRVRASNRSGTWSPHELAIPVHIQPAWWQSTAFRLALLVLAAMMVYALVQMRTRHLRLRQVELQRTVRERTADLEKLALALQRESAALKESSLTDPLTGLRNRRFLTQHIEADLALAVREYESHLNYGASLRDDAGLMFFLLDIDHFKYVNDRYGHAAGDAVLKQMSRPIRHRLPGDRLPGALGRRGISRRGACHAAHARRRTGRAAACRGRRSAIRTRRWQPVGKNLLDRFLLLSAVGAASRRARLERDGQYCRCGALRVKSAGRNGWLGALSARGESAEALLARSRRPLAEWAHSGEIDLLWSPEHSGMAAAIRSDGA